MAALPISLWDMQSCHLSKGMKCWVTLGFRHKASLFNGKDIVRCRKRYRSAKYIEEYNLFLLLKWWVLQGWEHLLD
jgi:hypothetical protein